MHDIQSSTLRKPTIILIEKTSVRRLACRWLCFVSSPLARKGSPKGRFLSFSHLVKSFSALAK